MNKSKATKVHVPTSNLGIQHVWPHDRQPDSQHPCTPLGVPSKKSFGSPGFTPNDVRTHGNDLDPTLKASPLVPPAQVVPEPKLPPTPAPSQGSPAFTPVYSPDPAPKASPKDVGTPGDSLGLSLKASPPDPVPAAQVVPEPKLPPTPPALSQGAIDRRVRRAMEPNAKGQYKVSQEIRKLWEEGSKDKVFKLFADCDHDTDAFIKRFSVKKDHEKELEVGTYFTFQTQEQLAEKPEKLFCMFASPNVT